MSIRSRAGRATAGAVVLSLLALATAQGSPGGAVASATTGSGVYQLLGNLPTDFEYAAIELGSGKALGTFHQRVIFQGQLVEFTGAVTCVSHDPVNHRAWVGGIVTTNTSLHPSFLQPRNAPGQDVWFRVVDYGEGNGSAADRTTFLGFVPDAGFLTSQAYCDGQPWPNSPPDDRTWPVSEGNIQVHD
jgi:hypothetical protein